MPPLVPLQILRYKTDWPVWKMAMRLQFEEAGLMLIMNEAFEEDAPILKMALQGGGGPCDAALGLILASADVARILAPSDITDQPLALWGRLCLGVEMRPDPEIEAEKKNGRELVLRHTKKRKTGSESGIEAIESVEGASVNGESEGSL